MRAAEADTRKHPAGVGRTLQDHPAAPARDYGRQRGTHTLISNLQQPNERGGEKKKKAKVAHFYLKSSLSM